MALWEGPSHNFKAISLTWPDPWVFYTGWMQTRNTVQGLNLQSLLKSPPCLLEVLSNIVSQLSLLKCCLVFFITLLAMVSASQTALGFRVMPPASMPALTLWKPPSYGSPCSEISVLLAMCLFPGSESDWLLISSHWSYWSSPVLNWPSTYQAWDALSWDQNEQDFPGHRKNTWVTG